MQLDTELRINLSRLSESTMSLMKTMKKLTDMGRLALQSMPGLKALCRFFLVVSFSAYSSIARADNRSARAPGVRIISLAPSMTEIVFALDSGSQLIGVTRYCDYPQETNDIPKIGGFSDLSVETLVAKQPTIVLGMPEHRFLKDGLESFGATVLLTSQNSIAEILDSILKVGTTLKKQVRAEKLVSKIRNDIEKISQRPALTPAPSVLVTVGGHTKPGTLDSVYAAGTNTLYNEFIELAGGQNVYSSKIEYAKLTTEALLALNPEIIIDLIPKQQEQSVAQHSAYQKQVIESWNSLTHLKAVDKRRVFVLDEEFAVNPGPRIAKTLELFANSINLVGEINAKR